MKVREAADAGWRPIPGIAVVVAALALAGCNNTTYGTGTSTGMQTVRDIAGIAGVAGSDDKKDIDYRARPPVVLPPDGSVLPPPGSGTQAIAAVDWPDDPDKRLEEFRRQRDARARGEDGEARPLNAYDPRFRLPDGGAATSGGPNYDPDASGALEARGSRDEDARARAAQAASQGNTQVDADGNPVRRYLTDPPVEYRRPEAEPVPDPNAPTTIAAAEDCKPPPAIRMPWRRARPGECQPGQGG